VKRPTKPRKSSALRTSLGLSSFGQDDEDENTGVVTPRRNNLSRLAIQRNAEKRSAGDPLPFRAGRDNDDDRPSYSKDYLQELKQSTPSTPTDLSSRAASPDDISLALQPQTQTLDLASKFGDVSRYTTTSAIPTDAEIREKKERRARLAKEHDFVSLEDNSANEDDDDDLDPNTTRDDNGRLILKPKEKYPETRLVRDDEDLMEDFDDFTTDGKIGLGRKAEREAQAKRKAEMAALIADAEGANGLDDDSEEDESELERNAAFEVAQTRRGDYGTRVEEDPGIARPRTPPRIAPLPTLDGVVERLRKRLMEMEMAKAGKVKEMQGLQEERKGIAAEEVRVQAALKGTAEKYRKLREEMGIAPLAENNDKQLATVDDVGAGDSIDEMRRRAGLGGGTGLGLGFGSSMMAGRGLDSMGGTPVRAGSNSSDD